MISLSGSVSIKAITLICSKNDGLLELFLKVLGPFSIQISFDLANLKRLESKFDIFWHTEFKWKAALWKIRNRCDGISKRKHSFSVVIYGFIDIWENLQAVNDYKILN